MGHYEISGLWKVLTSLRYHNISSFRNPARGILLSKPESNNYTTMQTHSTCLGLQWPDVNHIPDKQESSNFFAHRESWRVCWSQVCDIRKNNIFKIKVRINSVVFNQKCSFQSKVQENHCSFQPKSQKKHWFRWEVKELFWSKPVGILW